jgi:hypothetical protein
MEFISRAMRQSEGQSRLVDNFLLARQEEHRREMERIDREIERARELEHARNLAEIKRSETPEGGTSVLAENAQPSPRSNTSKLLDNALIRSATGWVVRYKSTEKAFSHKVGFSMIENADPLRHWNPVWSK